MKKCCATPSKQLPEKERGHIKLDVAKVDGVGIHEIDIKGSADDDFHKYTAAKEAFIAVAPDAVLMTAGPDGLKLMKQALAAKPTEGAVFSLDLAMLRASAFASRSDKADDKLQYKIAKEVFGEESSTGDKFVLAVEGGKSLKVKLSLKTQILKFFEHVEEAKKKSVDE